MGVLLWLVGKVSGLLGFLCVWWCSVCVFVLVWCCLVLICCWWMMCGLMYVLMNWV